MPRHQKRSKGQQLSKQQQQLLAVNASKRISEEESGYEEDDISKAYAVAALTNSDEEMKVTPSKLKKDTKSTAKEKAAPLHTKDL